MASRKLDDLQPKMKLKAFELLARCLEIGIPLVIVTTLRDSTEQAQKVKDGLSWTLNSRHLPQAPDGKSLAIDVCPYEKYLLHGDDKLMWDDSDPSWQKIGNIGTSLGLKWGVVTKRVHRDLGHFEWRD